MTYRIVSHLVGTPGDPYEPAEGINVDALLEHGFIELVNGTPKRAKSAKTEPEQPEE